MRELRHGLRVVRGVSGGKDVQRKFTICVQEPQLALTEIGWDAGHDKHLTTMAQFADVKSLLNVDLHTYRLRQ